MNKKTILLLCIALGLILAIILILFRGSTKNSLLSPVAHKQEAVQIKPSETLIEYNDPSGFSFSYPDNLSLVKNEVVDTDTYADIQLTDKAVNGSLSLKISDSKFTSLDEWVKLNKNASKDSPKEIKLGNLKALEIKTNDRLYLGALDLGVLFTIEMPLIENDFWMKVYNKVLSDFSFAPQSNESVTTQGGTNASSDDIAFEGEEVIE